MIEAHSTNYPNTQMELIGTWERMGAPPKRWYGNGAHPKTWYGNGHLLRGGMGTGHLMGGDMVYQSTGLCNHMQSMQK